MPNSSVHTAKNGAKYIILPNGRARFVAGGTIKKTRKVHKSKK
jgi:hypothetical protein